jgi:hypothetical protein
LKNLLKAALTSLVLILLLNVSLFAGEEGDGQGVNSTNMGLSVYGAAGYGQSLFGVIENSDDRGDLGAGPGGSFGFGALFNYSVLAVGVNFTQAYYKDTELRKAGRLLRQRVKVISEPLKSLEVLSYLQKKMTWVSPFSTAVIKNGK